MFLHAGWVHLGVNMYGLYLLGRFAEDVLTSPRFLVIYLLGGLGGALASTLVGQGALSVGASGAIMGLLGALIVVLMLRRGSWPEAFRRTLLWNLVFLGGLQIYIGFQVAMIDNAAHVGGLIAGAAAALLFAPGGILGAGRAGRAVVAGTAVALLLMVAASALQVARTSIDATFRRLPTREVAVGGAGITVPAYWELDGDHQRIVDPYLGIEVAPRVVGDTVELSSPQAGEAVLAPLFERMRTSARVP